MEMGCMRNHRNGIRTSCLRELMHIGAREVTYELAPVISIVFRRLNLEASRMKSTNFSGGLFIIDSL